MDKVIVDKIRVRDEEGLKQLKETYLSLILYVLKPFSLDDEDQEECVYDILMKLWNSLETYSPEKMSLKNYIALIARRTGLNYVRKNKHLSLPYEDMDIFGVEDIYEKIPWHEILSKLTEKEKVYFYRRFYYFQSLDTISLELGMTYKSVESQLYRLRKKLQRLIKEAGYDG